MTNKTRSRIPAIVVLAGIAALGAGLALAQSPASTPASSSPATATTPPAPASTGAKTPAAAATPRKGDTPPTDGKTGKPSPAASDPNTTTPAKAAGKGSSQHFEPTEKVRPDFDVAFPVDI